MLNDALRQIGGREVDEYIQQAAGLKDGFTALLKRVATMAQPGGAPFKFLINLKQKPRILEKMAKVLE